MGREENRRVFNETKSMCSGHPRLIKDIAFSRKWQRAVSEHDKILIKDRHLYEESAQVVVSDKRTMEAASAYRGYQVCVLNFASATIPGGGVTKGAGAQEESLCRVSTLYPCLNTGKMQSAFYNRHIKQRDPLHNDDLIYTAKVTVFKADTEVPSLLPEEDWYQVNVITCSAPDLKENRGIKPQITDRELLFLHEKRFRRILDAALRTKNEVVILGAFGCGVYENDPRIVAQAAKNVLSDYLYAFRVIEFAVHCTSKDMLNYTIFKKAFQNMR